MDDHKIIKASGAVGNDNVFCFVTVEFNYLIAIDKPIEWSPILKLQSMSKLKEIIHAYCSTINDVY